MWRKMLLIIVLVLVGGVLLIEFLPVQVIIWDGGYDLTVHFDTPTGPPTAAACFVVGRRERAEEWVADFRTLPIPLSRLPDEGGSASLADPFLGAPLKLRVLVSGRQSPFGREVSRAQQQALVVGADWPDGRRVWKVVEIPDGRTSREVRVSLP